MLPYLLLALISPLFVAAKCPEGKYWSQKYDECLLCSKCDQSYTLKPCDKFNDTICADEIKFSLDWLHPKEKNHHFIKERLHFIKDELDSIGTEKKKPHHIELNDLDDDDDDFEPRKKPKHSFNDLDDDFVVRRKNSKHFRFDDDDFDDDDDDEVKVKHKKHKKFLPFGTEIKKRNHKKGPRKHWSNVEDDEFLDVRDERELEAWLKDSEDELKHRKDDLLKTLKGNQAGSEKKFKMNHPNRRLIPEIFDDLVKHELHSKKEKSRAPVAEIDADLFRDLVDSHQDSLSVVKLLSNPDGANSLDYKSVVPTHRMFLGEPSTVSEIIGQVKDPQEMFRSEHHPKNVVLEKSKLTSAPSSGDEDPENEVYSVPFTPAETLIWDWQAVALVSAVAACLLFFVVAAIYILLSARDTKRVKYADHDAEEMTTMVALMPPESEDKPRACQPRPIVIQKPKATYGQAYVHTNLKMLS